MAPSNPTINQPKTIDKVGYVWGRFNQMEVYRLMQTLPIYGVFVDVHKPKQTKGSISGLKTTNLVYEDIPDYQDLKVLITNLEHYDQGTTIFESFQEDGFILKTLSQEPIKLPDSTKIVVKDKEGGEHKTFTTKKGMIAKTPVNGKITIKYELTPMYLHNNTQDMLDKAISLGQQEEQGAIIPDYVKEINQITKEIKEESYTQDEDDILIIDRDGGLYNDG